MLKQAQEALQNFRTKKEAAMKVSPKFFARRAARRGRSEVSRGVPSAAPIEGSGAAAKLKAWLRDLSPKSKKALRVGSYAGTGIGGAALGSAMTGSSEPPSYQPVYPPTV
jgi:hypothetical protein